MESNEAKVEEAVSGVEAGGDKSEDWKARPV